MAVESPEAFLKQMTLNFLSASPCSDKNVTPSQERRFFGPSLVFDRAFEYVSSCRTISLKTSDDKNPSSAAEESFS